MSLLEKAKAQVRDEAMKRLAMLEASAANIRKVGILADLLSARGWKPQVHISADTIAGVQLLLWINVSSQQRRAELLEELAGLSIPCVRADALTHGDCYGYVLTLADNLQVKLRLGVALAALAEAA
jgi:hypothetical protein